MGAPLGAASQSAVSGQRIAVARYARGRTMRALVQATRDLYGEEAVAQISVAMPEAARADLDEDAWVPLEHIIRWCELAWDGPLRREPRALVTFVDRMMDHGFGRVRRLLLAVATPAGLVRRAGDLWREEFSNGRLVAYATSPNAAAITLHDHAFMETELMRAVIAESFRYALQLSGATDAREEHEIHSNGALLVKISW
jgi:hypothetical protein